MRASTWKLGAVVTALALAALALALTGATKGTCTPEPEGCVSDAECGAGMYCDAGVCEVAPGQGEGCPDDVCDVGLTCVHYYGIAGPSGPEFATCEIPCSSDRDCPSDQQCVTIADGPGTVCQPRPEPVTCADWSAEYQALTLELRACTSAAQCVSVPGTSCGCTRNLVANGDNDLAELHDFIDRMNAAGCGLVSTCDCPPADGFVCENGLCAWNYTGWN